MCAASPVCSAPTKSTNSGRYCRWCLGNDTSRDLLMSGMPAALFISTTLRSGKVVEGEYMVYRTDGAWKFLKEENGKVVESYTIDCSFDESPDYWRCDCPDSRRRDHACKHLLGLVAGLRAIGLLNV